MVYFCVFKRVFRNVCVARSCVVLYSAARRVVCLVMRCCVVEVRGVRAW